MRLVIADSKGWFDLIGDFKETLDIRMINDKTQLTEEFLRTFQPDYVFFPHWNWVVSSSIHNNYNCIVFHTAPLPYGRGGSPIQNLILNGFETSPVCALKMTDELDAGPIYAKETVSLNGSLQQIFGRINEAVNSLIWEIISGRIEPKEQVGEISIFRRLTAEDNEIPAESSLANIYDRVRMLDHPAYPSAFIEYGNWKLEFSNAKLSDSELTVSCRITKY